MSAFQDGLLAFFCAVGVVTVLWLAAETFFHVGRPVIPELMLVLPVHGDAPALEQDMRELVRIQHQLPGVSVILADCGLSDEARKMARYLADREDNTRLVDAQNWKIT